MNNPRWEPRKCEKILHVRFLGRRIGCLQCVQICLCSQNPSRECQRGGPGVSNLLRKWEAQLLYQQMVGISLKRPFQRKQILMKRERGREGGFASSNDGDRRRWESFQGYFWCSSAWELTDVRTSQSTLKVDLRWKPPKVRNTGLALGVRTVPQTWFLEAGNVGFYLRQEAGSVWSAFPMKEQNSFMFPLPESIDPPKISFCLQKQQTLYNLIPLWSPLK